MRRAAKRQERRCAVATALAANGHRVALRLPGVTAEGMRGRASPMDVVPDEAEGRRSGNHWQPQRVRGGSASPPPRLSYLRRQVSSIRCGLWRREGRSFPPSGGNVESSLKPFEVTGSRSPAAPEPGRHPAGGVRVGVSFPPFLTHMPLPASSRTRPQAEDPGPGRHGGCGFVRECLRKALGSPIPGRGFALPGMTNREDCVRD